MRTLLMVALLGLAPLASAAGSKSASLPEMVQQQVALRDEVARGRQDLTPRQVGVIRKALRMHSTSLLGRQAIHVGS